MPSTEESNLPPRIFRTARVGDTYEDLSGDELTTPWLARLAWTIHAESYLGSGYVTRDAITADGYLIPEIDRARGPGVRYYVARHAHKGTDRATLRKVAPIDPGTFTDLPAYAASERSLDSSSIARLDDLRSGGAAFSEISALARTPGSSPLAAHELIRRVIADASASNEAWLVTLVAATCESLIGTYGSTNFRPLGDDFQLADPRVERTVWLRPLLIEPAAFLSNLLRDLRTESKPHRRRRLERGFLFMAAGFAVLTEEHESAKADLVAST